LTFLPTNRLPIAHLFITPFIRREAVLSSRIEGTQTDLFDLYAYEADCPFFLRTSTSRRLAENLFASPVLTIPQVQRFLE
jgi:hypothetical protein